MRFGVFESSIGLHGELVALEATQPLDIFAQRITTVASREKEDVTCDGDP
jgi:hypothetical protein